MKINTNQVNIHQNKVIERQNKEVSPDSVSIGLRKDISINYYPQDPFVGSPVKGTILSDITPGPDNKRIDTTGDVKPDQAGNMVFTPEQPEFMNVHTFSTVNKTINLMEKYLGRKINWSFGREQINLNPDKGKMMNAYYNKKEGSLNFFHFTDKKTGETIHTGKSFETVAHETGHAILDGIRPKLLGFNIEAEAIHEAFSDITSMISALQDENNIDMFLKQTDGDFSKTNIIADTGEQFGNSVLGRPYIRTARNSYNYKNPYELPITGSDEDLTGEAHNFCRVFTGAFYDIMGKVFAHNVSKGMSKKEALIKTGDVCGKLLMKGIDNCPPSDATYKDFAKGIIEADRTGGKGEYNKILSEVFSNRWIYLKDDHKALTFRERLNPDNKEGIVNFVDLNRENLGIDNNVILNCENLRKNKDGFTKLDVTYKTEVPLKGSDFGIFDGAIVELDGGVTLSLENSGKISGFASKSIDDKRIVNTKTLLKNLIKEGKIKFVDPSVKELKETDLFDASGRPYAGYTVYEEGKMKIVRSPVIQ
jgi:hypothetical protein